MKRIEKSILLLLLAVMVLTAVGCGKSKKEVHNKGKEVVSKEPDFILDENNCFTVLYEEDFEEYYYNKDELEAKIDSEIQEFNATYATESSGGISKEEFSVDNGKARLGLRFVNPQDYINYETNYVDSKRNARLFIGTYQDAVAAGYNVSRLLTSADGGTVLDENELLSSTDVFVIFTNQNFRMDIPGTVLAVSSSVKVDESTGVVLTSDKRENMLIFRREQNVAE